MSGFGMPEHVIPGDKLITEFINPGRNVTRPLNISKEDHRKNLKIIDGVVGEVISGNVSNFLNFVNIYESYNYYFALRLYGGLKKKFKAQCETYENENIQKIVNTFSTRGFGNVFSISQLCSITNIVRFLFSLVKTLNDSNDVKCGKLIIVCKVLSNLLTDFELNFDVLKTFLLVVRDSNKEGILDESNKHIVAAQLSEKITTFFNSIYSRKAYVINEIGYELDIYPHRRYYTLAKMVDLKNRNTAYVKFRNQHWISTDVYGSTEHELDFTAEFAAEHETVLKFEPNIYYPVKIDRPNGKLKLEGSNATIDVRESNGNAISRYADVFIGSSLIDELCKEFVELYLKVKTYDLNDLTVLQNNVNSSVFTTNTRGGSKTMRQRKQRQIKERQRKQKSKRKKTNS
jgi:hypothetical protein